MDLLLLAMAAFLLGGGGALLLGRRPVLASAAGAGGAVAGSVLGLISAVRVLAGGPVPSLRLPWHVPGGSFSLEADPLSAFFLIPLFVLAAAAALHGAQYLQAYRARKSLGPPWLFFNLLVASMALVLLARNGVLFLVAWEVMAIASFFLVTFEDEEESVRQAGWTYLVATHLGFAFLLGFFVLVGRGSGSLDFPAAGPAPGLAPEAAGPAFLLALVGFGTKAGLLPFHVWLPEAHPAAPSHVSALMSGVMIKTGIYGLLRALSFLGVPPAWWGYLLLGMGGFSALLGIGFALAQADLKRVLAYSSVENVGLIALGTGLGLLGLTFGSPAVAVLGLSGALLHLLGHSLHKGLLFLAAGSLVHGAGVRRVEELGGVLKRMRGTGHAFLTGAVAVCGLPPLGGFLGELLIYLAAFRAGAAAEPRLAVPGFLAVAALALSGGLAAAVFTRVFGAVFLGEPRGERARGAHQANGPMMLALGALVLTSFLLAALSPLVLEALGPVLGRLVPGAGPGAVPGAGLGLETVATELAEGARILTRVLLIWAILLAALACLAMLRALLLRGRTVESGPTWDCGYARPTARMQYTASSFAQPLTALFRLFLRTRRGETPPAGPFPRAASFSTSTADLFHERLYRPLFTGVDRALSRLRWLQQGRVQLYVLYIALTLVILLLWKLR